MIESKRSIIYRLMVLLQIKHPAFLYLAPIKAMFKPLLTVQSHDGVGFCLIQASIPNKIQR